MGYEVLIVPVAKVRNERRAVDIFPGDVGAVWVDGRMGRWFPNVPV